MFELMATIQVKSHRLHLTLRKFIPNLYTYIQFLFLIIDIIVVNENIILNYILIIVMCLYK